MPVPLRLPVAPGIENVPTVVCSPVSRSTCQIFRSPRPSCAKISPQYNAPAACAGRWSNTTLTIASAVTKTATIKTARGFDDKEDDAFIPSINTELRRKIVKSRHDDIFCVQDTSTSAQITSHTAAPPGTDGRRGHAKRAVAPLTAAIRSTGNRTLLPQLRVARSAVAKRRLHG